MKYIVIEARKPQNGSRAQTATVIFPDWVSPTLVCAGITGRIIELTDGGIIEQGETHLDEWEVLRELRGGASDLKTQQEEDEPRPSDDDGKPAHRDAEDAYREGMQAARTKMAELFQEYGYDPANGSMKEWIVAQFKALAAATDKLQEFEGVDEQVQKLEANYDKLWQLVLQEGYDIQVEYSTSLPVSLIRNGHHKSELNALREMNIPFEIGSTSAAPVINITGPVTINYGTV